VGLEEQIDKLPKWALPVGVGGLVGIGVLVTRKKGGTTPTTIPVGDITDDGTDDGTDATPSWLIQFGSTITDLISTSNTQMSALIAADDASDAEQMSTFLENFTSLQSGTMDNITDLITAQQTANTAQSSSIMAMIQAFTESMQTQIETITDLIETPPTTGASSIIDAFKKLFKDAFERVPKPFGNFQPNSDIIIGDFGASAPYKQDTGFTYYDTTGHFVTGPFRQFLGNFGGAKTYGRPLSQVFKDHDGFDTQVFTNAIMKFIPGSDPKHYNIVVIPVI
jgi:uncharacterized coiled-coil protein SlyX